MWEFRQGSFSNALFLFLVGFFSSFSFFFLFLIHFHVMDRSELIYFCEKLPLWGKATTGAISDEVLRRRETMAAASLIGKILTK